MNGLILLLPFDKPEDHAISTYCGRYDKFVIGLCVTGNDTILEDASNLNNKDNKEAKDDDDREEDDKGARNDANGEEKDND